SQSFKCKQWNQVQTCGRHPAVQDFILMVDQAINVGNATLVTRPEHSAGAVECQWLHLRELELSRWVPEHALEIGGSRSNHYLIPCLNTCVHISIGSGN